MTKNFKNRGILYTPPTLGIICFQSECSAVNSNFGTTTDSYTIFSGDNSDGTQSW